MKRQCLNSILVCLFLSMSSHQSIYGGEAAMLEDVGKTVAKTGEEALAEGGEAVASKIGGTTVAKGAESTASHTAETSGAEAAKLTKGMEVPKGDMYGDSSIGGKSIFEGDSAGIEEEDLAFHDAPGEAGSGMTGVTEKAPTTGTAASKSAEKADDVLGGASKTAPKTGTATPAKPTPAPKAGEPTIETPTAPTPSETQELDKMSSTEKTAFNKMSPKDHENYAKMSDAEKASFDKLTPREQEGFFESSAQEQTSLLKNADERADMAEMKAHQDDFFNFKGITAKGTAKSLGGKILGTAEIIGMAVLFMIPSIFESAFLAEEQRNALLLTYSAPIQFGNIVLQIPDSEINLTDPTMSDFLYYGIPVDDTESPLSAGAAAMYPGVHGPDKNNAICKGITSGYAKAFSLGTAKISPPPARYNLDASALSTLPIFVSYSENSWDTWGASAITDPSFGQMLINLNTGMVFYADGLSDSTPPAPLVGTAGGAKSVESYLSTKLGKLSTSGSASSFTEYSDTFSASKSSKSASPITNQFNCACLQKGGAAAVLSADTIASCTVAGSTGCLLVPTLNSLAAGMIISSAGKPLTTGQDLTTEVTAGALGQVVPIQGMGDKFSDYLDFFPGAQDEVMSSSNLTVEYGFLDASGSSTTAQKPKIEGAQPDNYAAKGVYVYQCKNTPFAKMLKSQAGGSATSGYNDHIFDFIVFFDEELNQVPLMVPMEDPKNYNFPTMLMNPAIKFWSTIIGNTDSKGNFAYLPQLMIVTAKGAAPIAPLYGLQAQGGHFQVNGNAQLESKIGGIVKDLESHAELGEQFKATRDAMLQLTLQGPFGKYNLRPVDSTMTPVIGGVKMSVYIGYNAYPVSQDEKATNCNDVLIPVGADGNTAILPSSAIVGYYGMVSDLSYSVASDGSLVVSSNKNSCFSQAVDASGQQVWKIDDTKANSYYWLTQLTSMNKGQSLPQPLIDYVHTARANWIAWVKKTNTSPISNVELTGVTWVGSNQGKHILKIVGQQALVNNLYIYTCMTNPSKLAQDFFVLTDSQNPVTTDTTLGTKSATTAKPTTNMLSLVSGLLYDSSGNPIKNSLGVIYQVDAMTLVNALYARNLKGFSDDFTTSIVNACNAYKKAESAFVYPFDFYTLKLGMYQADIDIACYVYGDAFGAGTSTTFKPRDYFVTYDTTKGVSSNQQLSSDASQCIVSLVSGIVYSKTAASATLSADSLKSLYATVSKYIRASLKADIDAAITAFAAQKTANSATDAQTQADAAASGVAGITWKPADVLAKITAIASQPYLPVPYVMLKQDPSSRQYVQVSPASTDGTDFMYTFFDVPYQDSKGATLYVGGMFDSKGNQLYLFGDLQLESALIQNGISIDTSSAKRQQLLGVPSLQPIMLIDKADLTLKAGATGKSMIHAADANFPSLGITSPITYQNRTSYFYYNTIMKAYYVMEVNGKDVRYISMAGGNIYNQDGSFRASLNPVALKNGTDATDIFLACLNADGYTECMMNNQTNSLYQLFTNVEGSFQGNVKLDPYGPVASNVLVAATTPYTQVSVIQSPRLGSIPPMPDVHDATQYNVYWDTKNPTIYKVDVTYAWQNLALLPINMTDRSMIDQKSMTGFRNAGMVLKNGKIDRMIFGNNVYAVASCSGSVCTMKQVSNPSVVITVSLKKDPKICTKDLTTGVMDPTTGVHYCEVVAGGITYNYQIIFDVLSADQLTSYQYNSWQSETVADVSGNIILTQFLPGSGSGTLQLKSVGIAAVANVPADDTSKNAVTNGLKRVEKDAVHGRFLGVIYASGGSDDQGPFYDYFNQDGYADLENGALFDSNGVPVGIALKMSDLMALSTKLSVTVTRDDKQVASLLYKAPSRFGRGSSTAAPATAAKSQGMVLGRLGSHEDQNSSSGIFGWVSSMISSVGSMIFGS